MQPNNEGCRNNENRRQVMYFAQDPDQQFFYMGSIEPHARLYNNWFKETSHPIVSLDTETISLKERIALGVGVAFSPEVAFYFPLFPTPSPSTPWDILRDDKVIKIWHNSLFDYSAVREFELSAENVRDTSVMSRLLLYKFNSLFNLSHIHLMPVQEVKDVMKIYKARTMLDVPQIEVARKCMQDCMATFKLHDELLPRTNRPYFDVEMQTIPIMVKMSYRGLLIDQEARLLHEGILEDEVENLRKVCEEAEGFNPGSPQQVSYILAKRGAYNVFSRLPFTRNKYGKRTSSLSTDISVLEQMEDPLAGLVLSYRTKAKLLGTYIRPWANEERAYTRYHLDAATGRPSSLDRNMQNLPGKDSPTRTNIREIILPDSGIWTDTDWSQLELRILAFLSGDREMAHIFSLPTLLPDGTKNPEADIHQRVADFLGIVRKISKNVDFAMVYGGTDECLRETAHIQSRERCSQLRQMWFGLFPQAGDYIQSRLEEVRRGATYSTTWFGRNMKLPDEEEDSLDGRQRKYINYAIQGTAADMMKRGLILLKDLDLALQVHDELLIDSYVPEDRFRCLESIAPFYSPVSVRYLSRWE